MASDVMIDFFDSVLPSIVIGDIAGSFLSALTKELNTV